MVGALEETVMPNNRAALDAGRTRCLHGECHRPGPSEKV
jgi:hypothetical protein